VALAARNLGEEITESTLSETALEPGAERRTRITGAGLRSAAEARLTYLPMDRATVRACWDVLVPRHDACSAPLTAHDDPSAVAVPNPFAVLLALRDDDDGTKRRN
jgi:hypothetical protein